jgi:regulator of sirC expression with transglutaminase-like and TPR domain
VDSSDAKERFRAELNRRDENPALDVLCYLICQLGGYAIDVADEQSRLDLATLHVPATFEGVIATLFGGDAPQLKGNPQTYYSARNSMLSEVQRTGVGIPITLSVVAIEYARRLHVPMVGIGLPGHFIVGCADDPDLFADPFNRGRILDRDGVRGFYRLLTQGRSPWREEFLEPVTSRDIVFRMLNNIRVACARNLNDRIHLPWVLELMSWFPHGQPFDIRAASRAVAAFN